MTAINNNIIDNEANNRTRILVIGPASRSIAGALLRMETRAEIIGVETAREAIEALKSGIYDHVLVDNRQDGAMALTIPSLARLENVANITVLAGPESAETISAVPGVSNVIIHPYNPVEIAKALDIEIKDSRKSEQDTVIAGRRSEDESAITSDARPGNPNVEDSSEDEDSRSVFIRSIIAIANFIPGFTPLLSLIYKNLALALLSALFVAFVMYGIMIAFFLTSGDWSTPLTLQRGHELVIKAERELGTLQVKRNLATKQLVDVQNKADRGRQSLTRATALSKIAEVTIDQEMENLEARYALVTNEVSAIKNLLKTYGSSEKRKRDRAELGRDYKRRVITRRIYEQSVLNNVEIEKTVISLREQMSRKQTEEKINRQEITYLSNLKTELLNGQEDVVLTSGNADFVPIANQIIEVKQIRANAMADIEEFYASSLVLENSKKVLSRSITELRNTPMIGALAKPVNVLFVPYSNLSAYEKGERLYVCSIAIFWCSNVGSVGKPISGEIMTTHPFFGKPIRGQFVEANLTEISAAQKEIIHVGRPPFFF